MQRQHFYGILLAICWNWAVLAGADWQVGVGRADITPRESVPLAGYSGPTRMSQRVEHPLWLKAIAFRDAAGLPAVVVTADLVGLSQQMVDRITAAAQDKYQLPRERLILNTSHNHSCPVTADVLWLYYELSPDEAAARDRYTELVYQQYDQVIGAALADLSPAEVEFEYGLAALAVNRRRARGAATRQFGNQVDHDVPVLTVHKEGQLKAILFGYSCHTTSLSGTDINGDYAGFAQISLEEDYRGCVAMFVQNCGGDANPLPRRRGSDAAAIALSRSYGLILAEAVRQVLATDMRPVAGPLRIARGETELQLQPGPTAEALRAQLPGSNGIRRREIEHWLSQYQREGSLPDRVPYPVQVWQFGDQLTYIALTGETVVDYSLKFKATYGWNTTWVTGYNNDLLSYVPSLRVLREGDYEGVTGMAEYGHRGPYTETVEENITALVDRLVAETRRPE